MIKKILIIIPALIILIAATIIILHWQTNVISNLSEEILNNQLGDIAQVEYESLSGDLFNNVIIRDLRVNFTNGTKLRSNYLKVHYSLGATISGQYFFDTIMFDSLNIFIPAPEDIELASSVAEPEKSIQERLNELASAIPLKSLLESLPEFSIDNLEILHGKVTIAVIDRTFEDIRLAMNARYSEESLEVKIERLSGREKARDFSLDLFHAQILGNKKRITLNQMEVKTPVSQIQAHAEITLGDSLWVILGLEDTHISFEDIQSVSGAHLADSGYVDLVLDLVGHPNRFSINLASRARFNTHKIDSLVIDGDYQSGAIYLRRGLITKDESFAHFNGTIAENFNELNLEFKHLDLADIQSEFIPTDLTGSLYLNTISLEDPSYSGAGRLQIIQSTLDTLYFDTLRITASAEDYKISILKPSFLRMGENSIFNFEGSLDKDQQIDFKLITEKNAVASLTAALNLPLVIGLFDGNFFLSGSITDPNLEGYLWIPHLEKDAFRLDSMIIQMKVEKLSTSRRGGGFIQASHWNYENLDITETMATIIFDSNRVVLDTLLFAKEQNYISSTGYLESKTDTFDLVFDFFRMNYQNSWVENSEELYIRATPEEFIIENARFKSSNEGLIEIRGYWDRILDEMQFGLYLENISFTPFKQFMGEDFNLSGIVNADFEVVNPLKNPELDVEVQGKNLMFNNVPFGDVHCIFQYEQEQLFIDEFKMSHGESTLDVDGDIAIEWGEGGEKQSVNILEESLADVQISWNHIHLENYSPLLKLHRPLKGEISGRLSLAGTITDPRGKLKIIANNMSYEKFYSDSLNLVAHFNRDSLIVDGLVMDLNETDFSGEGWQLIDLDFDNIDSLFAGRPFQIVLKSNDDQISFIGNFLDQVERIEGPYESEFTLGGTLDKPTLIEGYFRLEDGQLILSRIRNPITNLEIEATIDSSRLTINSLSGYAEKEKDFWEEAYSVVKGLFRFIRGETQTEGELYCEGDILLDDISHPTVNLTMESYKLYLDYFVENTDFVLSTSNLQIQGRDTISINGDITIEEGNYIVDLSKLKKNIYLKSSTSKNVRPVTWNLDVTLPGNFSISSSKLDLLNNFNFEIMGDLRTIQEANAPSMDITGHLEIISGKYGSWGQNFGIEMGTIDFTDPKVINPDVNIRAQKRAGDYFVELTVTGNLEALKQDLQVKDENGNYLTNLSDEEILSLVALGRMDYDVASAGKQVLSTSVETVFERGAEALTGLDKVEVASASNGNILDFQSFSLGKYLTSNLYVEYTGMLGSNAVPSPTVSWKPGNQIGIEYRIDKYWSIDSHYLRTLKGNNIYRVSLGWKTSF